MDFLQCNRCLAGMFVTAARVAFSWAFTKVHYNPLRFTTAVSSLLLGAQVANYFEGGI